MDILNNPRAWRRQAIDLGQLGGSIAIAQVQVRSGKWAWEVDKPTQTIAEKQTLSLCGAIPSCGYVLGAMQR